MDYINDNLRKLEEIARNPNLNGGVCNSFYLFVSISDKLLQKKSLFYYRNKGEGSGNEEIIKALESIRGNFESVFGFRLSGSAKLGDKFESKKNDKKESHKFRNKLSKYIKSYANSFL
jgi:hypothetical protein